MTNSTRQEPGKQLVNELVGCTVSPLIFSLSSMKGIEAWEHYDDLFSLTSPIQDYEGTLQDELDLDVLQREPLEFWIVDKGLAHHLRQKGERVVEISGLTVWARTGHGQTIYELVGCTVSPLIFSLLSMKGIEAWEYYDDLFSLTSPIQDYEGTLQNEGFSKDENGYWSHPEHGVFDLAGFDCRSPVEPAQICDELDLDVLQREPLEFWIVDKGLAHHHLRQKGERVVEISGLTVWARTGHGQALFG